METSIAQCMTSFGIDNDSTQDTQELKLDTQDKDSSNSNIDSQTHTPECECNDCKQMGFCNCDYCIKQADFQFYKGFLLKTFSAIKKYNLLKNTSYFNFIHVCKENLNRISQIQDKMSREPFTWDETKEEMLNLSKTCFEQAYNYLQNLFMETRCQNIIENEVNKEVENFIATGEEVTNSFDFELPINISYNPQPEDCENPADADDYFYFYDMDEGCYKCSRHSLSNSHSHADTRSKSVIEDCDSDCESEDENSHHHCCYCKYE